MSNIPSNPPAPSTSPAAPAAPAATSGPGNVARNVLPSGVKVDHAHSADGFFEAHKQANAAPGEGGAPTPPAAPVVAPPAGAVPAAPVVTPPAAPTAPTEPIVEAPKGSLAAKLASRKKTDAAPPAAPTHEPAAPGENPEDRVTLDQSYTPKAHESFNQIKTIAKGLRDQLSAARENERQLKAQLDAAKATPDSADAGELEKLRTENQRLSERLMLVDLREHPRFQAEFIQPQQSALSAATELLASAGVQGMDLSSLLLKPRAEFGKAVSEMAQKLSSFDQTDFAENMRRAWTLNQQAGAALSKSRETYSGLRNQTEAQQKQAFDRTWGRAAGQVAEHIVELEIPENATPEVRQEIEAYNGAFKGLRTVAEQRAFGLATPEVIAENAIKSAAYDFHIQQAMPKLVKEIDSLLRLNAQLSSELKGIRDRNPNRQISGTSPAGGGGGPIGGGGPDGALSHEQLSKMDHAAAAAALAPRRLG